jgi:hypothetical protein
VGHGFGWKGLIQLGPAALRPADRVLIQETPVADMMARLEPRLHDQKRMMILMETLWQARALIERRTLELETVIWRCAQCVFRKHRLGSRCASLAQFRF